jgi:hypothetical protein
MSREICVAVQNWSKEELAGVNTNEMSRVWEEFFDALLESALISSTASSLIT